MRIWIRSGRWQGAVGVALAVALSCSLAGSVPAAFAEDEEPSGVQVPEENKATEPEDGRDELLGSAFKLGDVKLNVSVVAEGKQTDVLAVGSVTERTYRIVNEGEPAYLRLASSLVCGNLVQPSQLDVSDTPNGFSSSDEEREVPTCPWCLAKDGWWYRGEPLAAGESIVVCVPVEIPFDAEWVEAFKTGAPSSVEERVQVEAVQARNMRIDIAAAHPWGDVEVESLAQASPEPDDGGSREPEQGEDAEGGDAS